MAFLDYHVEVFSFDRQGGNPLAIFKTAENSTIAEDFDSFVISARFDITNMCTFAEAES